MEDREAHQSVRVVKSMRHSKKVGLYQFYNWQVDKWGEPFALCDTCVKLQPIPEGCDLRKIADKALKLCERVGI
jgi:hypothetical protein